MARPAGIDTKFAARIALPAATYPWGTAIPVGPLDQILHRPHGFKKSRPFEVDDSLGTGGFATTGDLGAITASGDFQAYLRYAGLDLLIAMLMGESATTFIGGTAFNCTGAGSTTTAVKSAAGLTVDAEIGKYWICTADAGNPANVGQVRLITDNDATTLTWVGALPAATSSTTQGTISAGKATHVYTLADSLEGIFATGCIWNGLSVEELTSFKVAGLTIKGATGKSCEIALDLIANDKKLSSAVNTAATTWTVRESSNRIMDSHLVLRMNTSGGAALQASDALRFESWELAIKRKLSGVYGVGSVANQIDEPSNDGPTEITFKGVKPRFDSATPLTEWEAGTYKKMDLTFTGAEISGGTMRSLLIEVPYMRYSLAEAPIVDGILKNNLEFVCMQAPAAPTGMTNLVKPVRMTLVNDFCGNPLQVGN